MRRRRNRPAGTGRVAGLLEFQTAVEEIFDVQLLPDVRFPEVVGFQKENVYHTFVVLPGRPDQASNATGHTLLALVGNEAIPERIRNRMCRVVL